MEDTTINQMVTRLVHAQVVLSRFVIQMHFFLILELGAEKLTMHIPFLNYVRSV